MENCNLKTGITRHRGHHVWYAAVTYRGKRYSRRGDSRVACLGLLERALYKVAGHRVYLASF